MCERCLRNERAEAMNRELIDADISGDEADVQLYRQVRRVALAFVYSSV